MKKIYILVFSSMPLLWSCDTTINPELQSASPVYVVDAFITNDLTQDQVIHLSYSQGYFDQELPPPVSGATVLVKDADGDEFPFNENPSVPGDYTWVPWGTELGVTGHTYTLTVSVNGETFTSTTKMGRVPRIDSITFAPGDRATDGTNFYRGQFWATDPLGIGDTYWIKAYKNGVLLNKPAEINLAYDATFSSGSNLDGVTFIQPIRNGINPEDTDSNNKALSPYSPGDSVYVEIHSLSIASFDFLTQVVEQTNRPGGFSELFSKPLANVSTNITNNDPNGTTVVGFFNVASVSGLGKKFVK